MAGTNVARLAEDDCEWVRAHEALSRLARERAAADAEEGRWLLAGRRSAAHVHLGFASFGEYIERLFGYTRRTVQEKLRVAEALEELPRLAHALETGSLGWSAARELTRVAVADTEQGWLDFAKGKTLRQLEEIVAGKRPGDDPSAPALPSVARRVLRFEVEPETFALFNEALTALRRRSGEAWDDDSALLEMARQVLGGPADDGRASYQIALTVCPSCANGQQQAGGELVPVAGEVVEMAQCDGQHLGCIPSRAANENGRLADAHVDAAALRPDARVDAAALRPDAHVDAAALRPHAHVDAAALCPDAHVDATVPRPDADALPRAKQTIPPALRRAALLRDQHRCRVPGCRNATFVDLHHIDLRSEGGRNELANVVTVCGAHHRAAHRGQLVIEGDAHVSLCFRHGDGAEYGQTLQPRALDVSAKIFSALQGLGFREREIRAVLAELRQDNELRNASISELLRESLRRIHVPSVRR
jgi:hypothetical protein